MTNASNVPANAFDFNDLSDLPEEMQKRLATDTSDTANQFADVVRAGKDAGYDELNINQIMAAATRMGLEVPTQQTVRGYLNKAVEMGLLSKPTRQTYAVGTKKTRTTKAETAGLDAAEVATAEAAPAEAADDDPLAGIGS